MTVLLTGGRGMLGRTISRILQGQATRDGGAFRIVPTDLPEADVTDEDAIDAVLAAARPDAVIHCAAATAVDACEASPERAYRLNARGSANVAAACHRQGVRLIAISTDYVFAGDAAKAYTEFDAANGGSTGSPSSRARNWFGGCARTTAFAASAGSMALAGRASSTRC